MKPWKIIVFPLLATLAIGGIYLFVVFKHRQDPGLAAREAESAPVDHDDLAEVRSLMPTEFKDVQKLEGTAVWMKNGFVIPYFACSGGRVDFARRIGVVPGAQRLDVKKVIKAAVPATLDDGMSHGSRQAFAVFAIAPGADLYAVPIGVMEGGSEAYFTDLLFYYDDPRKIYDWPQSVWTAIDAHRAAPGMTETAAHLALGRIVKADGDSHGNRTVTYDQGEKQWIVTFVDNRATQINAK